MLRLIDPTAGTIYFEGTDITEMRGDPLRRLRRRMQIVSKDPFASLNPRMTVGEILEEPLIVHGIGDRVARRARVNQLLGLVGIATYHAQRYPHKFSGGQRQRIGIARACRLAGAGRVQWIGVRARCVDPGAGGQSAEGPAGAVGVVLSRPRSCLDPKSCSPFPTKIATPDLGAAMPYVLNPNRGP